MSYGIYQKGRFLADVLCCQCCHGIRKQWLDMGASVLKAFGREAIRAAKCGDGRAYAVY